MSEIAITESIDVLSPDPKRPGKYDRWITYTVDGSRTDLLIIPVEDATEAKILAAIKVKEADRAKLVGKKFTV
jgi:hypothetical protein